MEYKNLSKIIDITKKIDELEYHLDVCYCIKDENDYSLRFYNIQYLNELKQYDSNADILKKHIRQFINSYKEEIEQRRQTLINSLSSL